MILKVRSCGSPEVWHYFDGVMQLSKQMHYAPSEDAVEKTQDNIITRFDLYDFTSNSLKFSKEDKRDGFLEVWLYGKSDEDTKQILCYRPVYLLNNEGKTIDSL